MTTNGAGSFRAHVTSMKRAKELVPGDIVLISLIGYKTVVSIRHADGIIYFRLCGEEDEWDNFKESFWEVVHL